MTLQSVFLVVGSLGSVWQAASEESKVRFIDRLGESASDEESQEVLFGILAKRPWPGVARA